jgi:hypothetical protein
MGIGGGESEGGGGGRSRGEVEDFGWAVICPLGGKGAEGYGFAFVCCRHSG